ncbi:MAG: ATP-binding cassette domain-containing protein [Microbacterium sp.]
MNVEHLALRLSGVSIIEDLSAQFPPRQLSVVVGPSGSGKSSLLALISGHRTPTAGSISVQDEDGALIPRSEIRFGWIAQGSNALPARSAIDNVMIGALSRGMPLESARAQAGQALEAVRLKHRADTTAKYLSGGELQRLSIARALLMECSVLLADEPTASLDRANAQMVTQILSEIEWPCTVIIATHDADVESVANYSLRLR